MESRSGTITFEATITFTVDFDESQFMTNTATVPTSVVAAKWCAKGIVDAMAVTTQPLSIFDNPRYGNPRIITTSIQEKK